MSDSDAFWAREPSETPARAGGSRPGLPFRQSGLVGVRLREIGVPVGGWPGWIAVDVDVVVIAALGRTYTFQRSSTRTMMAGGSFAPRIRFTSADVAQAVEFMPLDDGRDVRAALDLAGFSDW